jgi:type I restriction enzyme, S subunit
MGWMGGAMSDWQNTTLGAVAEIASHKTAAANVTLDTYISTENMLPNFGGVQTSSSLPNADKFHSYRKGDTLFSNIRTYFKKVWFADKNGGASADILVFRSLDTDTLEPRFLYCLLASQRFIDFSDLTSKGAKMPRGDKGAMLGFEFNLPPLATQRAIAHSLGALDDKIALNRRMNATLEGMARALFKDWFVDFGPVRAKMAGSAPTLDAALWGLFPSAIGEDGVPVGWVEKPLDEIATFLNGLALQKFPATALDGLPIIKIADLRAGLANNGYASKAIPAPYVVKNGDVLFSWSGSLIQRVWTGGDGALNQHLFKVFSTQHPKWLHYFWVDYHLPEFQRIAASKATTMGHIQRQHLTAAKVILGGDAVMKAADARIAPLFEKFIKNDLQSKTLATLRDTLLPKLLSGELACNIAVDVCV